MSAFAIYTHNKHLYAFKKNKKVENATYYTILRFQPYYIYQTENRSDYTILAYRITR